MIFKLKLLSLPFQLSSTATKYINKTLQQMKQNSVDEENPSTLEALLNRGMSPKNAMLTVIDMLMAGVDTVSLLESFGFV